MKRSLLLFLEIIIVMVLAQATSGIVYAADVDQKRENISVFSEDINKAAVQPCLPQFSGESKGIVLLCFQIKSKVNGKVFKWMVSPDANSLEPLRITEKKEATLGVEVMERKPVEIHLRYPEPVSPQASDPYAKIPDELDWAVEKSTANQGIVVGHGAFSIASGEFDPNYPGSPGKFSIKEKIYTFMPSENGKAATELNVVSSSEFKSQLNAAGMTDKSESYKILITFGPTADTYIAGLRVGLAAAGGGAASRSYEAKKITGTDQHELRLASVDTVTPELVLGTGIFFCERDYTLTRGFLGHFGLYAGLGIASSEVSDNFEAKLSLFHSFYLGPEWEFNKRWSIAPAVVTRRVTRLRSGYEIGDYIDPGDLDDATTEQYELGWAVVINLGPEFFDGLFGKGGGNDQSQNKD